MKKTLTLFVATLLIISSAPAQTGKDKALETIGAVSAMMVYNTYVAIGSVSDAYEDKVYEAAYVAEIMTEQVNSMDAMVNTYNQLLASGFITDPLDKDFINDLVTTCGYLKNQAQSMKDYSVTGAQSDSDRFQRYRNDAWSKISIMLGFEDQK